MDMRLGGTCTDCSFLLSHERLCQVILMFSAHSFCALPGEFAPVSLHVKCTVTTALLLASLSFSVLCVNGFFKKIGDGDSPCPGKEVLDGLQLGGFDSGTQSWRECFLCSVDQDIA